MNIPCKYGSIKSKTCSRKKKYTNYVYILVKPKTNQETVKVRKSQHIQNRENRIVARLSYIL